MRSVECQVAAAVVAARSMGVAASDPARLAGSGLLARAGLGLQALPDFVRRQVDSDQVLAFAHLVQCSGLAASQALLHRTGHSRREALCPAGTFSETVALDFVGFIMGASDFLTTVSDAAHPSFSEADFFWDHRSIPIFPVTIMAIITATDLRLRNSQLS
jgi:hypothetical protein